MVMSKILDATLSSKDMIAAIAVFDPTGHASRAWTIVSLGLIVCQLNQSTRSGKLIRK